MEHPEQEAIIEPNEWVDNVEETGDKFDEDDQSDHKNKTQLDWADVIDFVEAQKRKQDILDVDSKLDKEQESSKVALLDEKLRKQEEINQKLAARVKMLEFALKQQIAGKRNQGKSETLTDSQPGEGIAMRRARPAKPGIVKFLEEIGYEDIFNGEEVKEINQMFTRNTQNMSKNELVLESIHKFDAEIGIKENADEAQSQNGSNGGDKVEEQVSDHQLKALASKNFRKMDDLPTYHLKSHLDTVRDGQFIPKLDLAVTVSEDCTVKLWDLKNIDQQDSNLTENIKYNFIDDGTDFAGDSKSFYSYCTLRGHTGIVTKVAVGPTGDQGTLMYTAGIEGIVRAWKVPESVKEFEQNDDLSSKLCAYIWQAHPNEIIWDLKHHSYENLILTASADGIVSLWKTPTLSEIPKLLDDELENSKLEDKLFVRSFQLSEEMNDNEVPTSVDWSKVNPNQFIVSYTTGEIGVFDYNQEAPLFKFAYGEPSIGDLQSKQINMLKTHPTLNLAITVSENGVISVFDLDESGKCIRLIENAHSGPISSLAISSDGISFATAGHDGKILLWDMRYETTSASSATSSLKTYGEITNVHGSKFGESICNLTMHDSLPILMSCGADGIVKLHTNVEL